MAFLTQKNLMKIPAWPRDMVYHTTGNYYECIRCQLGRFCPRDIPRTMIPRQCRYGRWAPGAGPYANNQPSSSDPVKEWKKKADSETLDKIDVDDKMDPVLNPHQRHYLKRILLETVSGVLGIISEAIGTHTLTTDIGWMIPSSYRSSRTSSRITSSSVE